MSLQAVKSSEPVMDAYDAADELLALADIMLLLSERDCAPLDNTIRTVSDMICDRAKIVRDAIHIKTAD